MTLCIIFMLISQKLVEERTITLEKNAKGELGISIIVSFFCVIIMCCMCCCHDNREGYLAKSQSLSTESLKILLVSCMKSVILDLRCLYKKQAYHSR